MHANREYDGIYGERPPKARESEWMNVLACVFLIGLGMAAGSAATFMLMISYFTNK